MSNKELTKKHMEVMQAYLDGKTIQFRKLGEVCWVDCAVPLWEWFTYDYRVKPETIKYRVALLKFDEARDYSADRPSLHVCTEEEDRQSPREKWISFIQWLTDWQEVEVCFQTKEKQA